MSSIYSKVTIEKNQRSQNFDFLSLKIYHQASVWGALTHANIINFSKVLLQLKNQSPGSKTVCGFLLF